MAYGMTFKKLYYSVILSLCLIFSLAICVSAHDADWTNTGFATTGFDNPAALNDANYNSYTSAWTEATITLSRSDEIHSLYIVFDRIPPLWTLTDPVSGQNILGGKKSHGKLCQHRSAIYGKNGVIQPIQHG